MRLSINEAQEQLNRLSNELAKSHTGIMVTRGNKPVLAILSWDLYEDIMETLEVMGDADLMAQLRQSVADVSTSRTLSLDEIRIRLG